MSFTPLKRNLLQPYNCEYPVRCSGSGIVKVVFGDDGPSSFVYPTLNFMSDASGSDAESTGRKLLTEHRCVHACVHVIMKLRHCRYKTSHA